MQSLWDADAAARYDTDLERCAYASRLLGRERSLVLHGGGNTSVKLRTPTIFGEMEDILYVKGSGFDLATITTAGFAPVRLAHLRRLAGLEQLSDLAMARELRSQLIDPAAPDPSVEAILHALLPAPFVDHTHADSILAITNTRDGAERIRAIYGDLVIVVPYVMPGFQLARCCAPLIAEQLGPATIGMILLNHGVVSFGATAEQAYLRMIDLVTRAEQYLAEQHAWTVSLPPVVPDPAPVR